MDENLPLHLPDLFVQSVVKYRGRIALAAVGGPSVTYEDIGRLVASTRNLLIAEGV